MSATSRRVQGVAWLWEYSGNDCTWKTFRSTSVTYRRRRMIYKERP